MTRRLLLYAVILSAVLSFLLAALVMTQPTARISLRLITGFTPLMEDPRVFYEPGAEKLAQRIAAALPASLTKISDFQSRPVKPGFRIYISSTHSRFTQYIGHPVNSPVRGTAFLSDVWISPKAFDFHGKDTHGSTLTHELSHLHLVQHLGWFRKTRNLPAWFVEGLADWVADTGNEIVTRQEAITKLMSPHHLVPDSRGNLPLPRGANDYALSWPMFHAQSRLFVDYLHILDPTAFNAFVAQLVSGAGFDQAFRKQFGTELIVTWKQFLETLPGQLKA